jgi:hypothetical protein
VFAAETVPADYEIQQFFLTEKYIRRIDILAVRAFLLSRKEGAVSMSRVYFTNDEVIDFLERQCEKQHGLVKLPQPYAWPEFPRRQPRKGEDDDQAKALDRGHIYEQKTKYIDRILSAMYRIRPVLPGGQRSTFLQVFNEVRPIIIQPCVKNAEAIVASNHYFGSILRDHKVTSDELTTLLRGASAQEGVRHLAERLEFSLAETAQFVCDIRYADGRFVNGKWESSLLDFLCMVAPKRGSAAGKVSQRAWRDYAGALKRASDAYQKAKRAKRAQPNLDDWFGDWKLLPSSVGWEVTLGSALINAAEFTQALAYFVAEHDSRERNDWAAYRLLLTDYIGVGERGECLPRQARNCLRAVMLGYLETFEVVVGDDCRSCSRCRPGGNFETDLAWRNNQMVVRLGAAISGHLRDLKTREQAIPSPEETEHFWSEVEEEERAGRSLKGYVLGWTAKLLTDTPGHQAALWLRLAGMMRETLTFQLEEFLDHAETLAANCGHEAAAQLLELLTAAPPRTGEPPRLWCTLARLAQRLGRNEEAVCHWRKLLESAETARGPIGADVVALTYEAHAALAELSAPGSPLADPERYQLHTWSAARTAADLEKALVHYSALVRSWQSETLGEELEWLGARGAANLAPRLVRTWVEVDPECRVAEAVRWVATEERWKSWDEQPTIELLNGFPPQWRDSAPALRWWQVEAWLRGLESPGDQVLTAAALKALRDGWMPAPSTLRRVAQLLFEKLSEGEAAEALSSSGMERGALHDSLDPVFGPKTASSLVRWLTWLPLDRLTSTSERVLRTLRLGSDLIIGEPEVKGGNLRQRLVEALRPVRDAGRTAGCSPDAVHQLWLSICQRRPDEARQYLADLLRADAPAARLDDVLELMLRDNEADFGSLRDTLTPVRADRRSERLRRVLKLTAYLQRVEESSDVAISSSLRTEHLAEIRSIFGPPRDIESADMAVELLRHLRRCLNPRWLTPVKDLIQALVGARRFNEAAELSAQVHSSSAVGELEIRGQPVESYLKERCRGASREPPPEKEDYRRVITAMTRRWACLRPRGREQPPRSR